LGSGRANDAAVAQVDHAVAATQRARVVGGDQEGRPLCVAAFAHQVEHLIATGRRRVVLVSTLFGQDGFYPEMLPQLSLLQAPSSSATEARRFSCSIRPDVAERCSIQCNTDHKCGIIPLAEFQMAPANGR
jgi:predicted HD phosphohydrolase